MDIPARARENLNDSLDKMLASDKPYLLEVLVEKEENVFPMVPTGRLRGRYQIRIS